MVTATKNMKRSRANSAEQSKPKQIVLRIEKRLRFGGTIYISEFEPGEWTFACNVRDGKLNELLEVEFATVGLYESEGDAIREAFHFVGQGVDDFHEANHGHADRLATVKAQLQEQCRQIIGAGIPGTQAEAAAKEAVLLGPTVMSLPNGRTAWLCHGCGSHNDGEEAKCLQCGSGVNGEPPKGKKGKPQAAPAAGESLREISIADISPSPLNPRTSFDEAALQELATSITNHGLLQPIVVYQVSGRSTPYEIVCGERRWRASQLSKRTTVLARVLTCTEQEAIELRVVENLKREDLNAIDEANGFRQMIDRCGYSQRDLAARLGVSQGHIGNRLGLLNLPEPWLGRVITGEITATQGRELASWADNLAFMSEFAEWYDQAELAERSMEWSSTIKDIPWEISRSLKGCFYDCVGMRNVDVCLSKKDLEHPDLDIRELPARSRWSDPERRAFNLELWNELQAAGLARRTKAASKKMDQEDSTKSGSSSNDRSPEKEKELREQQAKAWQKKLYRHKIAWIQRAVIAKLDPHVNFVGKANLLIKLLLHFSSIHERRWREYEMNELLKKAGLKGDLLTLSSDRVVELALPIVLRWLADSFEGWQVHFKPAQFEQLAAELEIDFDSDYRVELELLELAPKAKLQAWAKEWGIDGYSDRRSEAVAEMAIDFAGKAKAPKELLNLKPVQL